MKAEKGSECHITEYPCWLLQTQPRTDFFFTGIEYSSQLHKMIRACTPSIHSTPEWNSASKESPEELLPLPENLNCKTSISQYWFCKISSCLKSQDAKWLMTNTMMLLNTEWINHLFPDTPGCQLHTQMSTSQLESPHEWLNKDRRWHFHVLKN